MVIGDSLGTDAATTLPSKLALAAANASTLEKPKSEIWGFSERGNLETVERWNRGALALMATRPQRR
jgi:hypothetical protein